MDKPARKPNRLKNYDYSSDGMYFITLCTKNKEHLLCNIVGDGAPDVPSTHETRVNLTKTGEIAKKYILSANKTKGVTIDKYVIMPNHIHLLISVNRSETVLLPTCKSGTSKAPSPTNAIIPQVVSAFKRLVNKETGKDIFQRSYHDHIIRGEKDYEKIWEYIDTNPTKWESDCFYSD